MEGGEKFSFAGLLGGYLREASVLVLVFGFLDPLATGVAHGTVGERMSAVPGDWALLVLFASLFLLGIGVLLEWVRKP